ncbi:hypothetical protein [Nocardioides yefusunii]|uniref:DUF222 domain-containing protein n=1 Tax=Nocardioides yefusunii TaxID=2500546 RepID=A0ABW1R042_9ACTN|nr:hypothetical protein [Nocardioides yefusunii]
MNDEVRTARELNGAGEVLSALRTAVAKQRSVEAELLLLAAEWGLLHPSADGTQQAADAAVHSEDGEFEPIAGPGCPGVSEYSVAEFATALGVTSAQAKRLVGNGLELAHRLPRLWSRVQSGDVPVAAARQVADASTAAHPPLTVEAADWLDQRVAPFVGLVGPDQLREALDEAVVQFGLAVESDADVVAGPTRSVVVSPLAEAYSGLARVEAVLDLADAFDLEQAAESGARDLAALAPGTAHAELRATALGELARRQSSFDLGGSAARRVDLTLHFSAVLTADGDVEISPTGRLAEAGGVLLRHVREWTRGSHTEVHVHPVVDG